MTYYHHLGPWAFDNGHYAGVPVVIAPDDNVIEYLPDFGELQDYE